MDGGVLRANTGSGTFFKTDRHRLLLSAGINRITVEAAAATPVRLDRIASAAPPVARGPKVFPSR